MELKLQMVHELLILPKPLIVPYGIETLEAERIVVIYIAPLIVPYGIETFP